MIDPSPSLGLVRLALDAAALRQQALAANIANAATPGFQPMRVSFEEQLDAVRQSLQAGRAPSLASLASLAPRLVQDGTPVEDGQPANLDLQVAEVAENVLHYQALLRGVSKQLSILSSAINEGKR